MLTFRKCVESGRFFRGRRFRASLSRFFVRDAPGDDARVCPALGSNQARRLGGLFIFFKVRTRGLLFLAGFFCSLSAKALTTDVINMPTGRLLPDGAWVWEYGYAYPYVPLRTYAGILPWLQVGGGVMGIRSVPGFNEQQQQVFTDYGNYKDKIFFGKVQLLNESSYVPAVALSLYDPLGTGLFRGGALSASKRFGNLDLTVGYGVDRPDGLFGGMRYDIPLSDNSRVALLAEYDAIDYPKDKFAAQTGLTKSDQRIAYGLEYRWNWVGLRVTREHDQNGYYGFVEIPLERKDFIPKFEEPERYRKVTPQPSEAMWLDDPRTRRRLLSALLEQGFRDIRVDYRPERKTMMLAVSHPRISLMSRAVGRAAQVALLLGPVETREIQVSYVDGGMALATYTFFDVARLRRYFNGQIPLRDLSGYVDIHHARPFPVGQSERDAREVRESLQEVGNPDSARLIVLTDDGDAIAFKGGDYDNNSHIVRLNLQSYLNGPGAFQYSLNLQGGLRRYLAPRTPFDVGLALPLYETLSDAGVVESDSQIPIVRSDAAMYRVSGKLRLDRMVLSHYLHPASNVYARISAGIYEEAYGGFGGQILYAPESKPWAVDLAVDAVQKRDYDGWFGFFDYRTVTGLASLHYRLGRGMTATARAGRFLAQDVGVRLEVKRRFASGFELGAWYTRTNANDTTGPAAAEGGSYDDKGVFASFAFESMLPRDTRTRGAISLAAWGRDPGQMVVSPGDVYGLIESPLRYNLLDGNGLAQLADVDDDPRLPSLGTGFLDRPILELAQPDLIDSFELYSHGRPWRNLALGTGLTVVSAGLDESADRWAKKYGSNQWVDGLRKVGDAVPYVAVGLAGIAASDAQDPRLARTGLSSLLAVGTGAVIGEAAAAIIGRCRPDVEKGPWEFGDCHSDGSLPSSHVTVAWAAVTPFAKEYDVPWLYGIAALTNFSRVAGRRHWFSDTVAAAVLGYGVGSLLWESRRAKRDEGPTVYLTGKGVGVSVPIK